MNLSKNSSIQLFEICNLDEMHFLVCCVWSKGPISINPLHFLWCIDNVKKLKFMSRKILHVLETKEMYISVQIKIISLRLEDFSKLIKIDSCSEKNVSRLCDQLVTQKVDYFILAATSLLACSAIRNNMNPCHPSMQTLVEGSSILVVAC